MKLKNLVKLFCLATFLILCCNCLSVNAVKIWNGIKYEESKTQKDGLPVLHIHNKIDGKMDNFTKEMERQKFFPNVIISPDLVYAMANSAETQNYCITLSPKSKSTPQNNCCAEKWALELLQNNPNNSNKKFKDILFNNKEGFAPIRCFPYDKTADGRIVFDFSGPLMTKQEIQERLKNKPKPAAEGAPLPAPVKDNIPNPYADLPTETSATKAKPAVKEAPVSSANEVKVFVDKNCPVHYQFSDCRLPDGSVVKKLTVFNQITHSKTARDFGSWIRNYKTELSILELQDGLIYHYDIASQNLRIYPGPNCQDFEVQEWALVAMDFELGTHHIQGNTTVLDRYTTWHGEKREKTYTSYTKVKIGRKIKDVYVDDPRITVPKGFIESKNGDVVAAWTLMFWWPHGSRNFSNLYFGEKCVVKSRFK